MDTSSASVAASGEKPMMFTFGRFVLDPERAVLSADGVDVPLRPKSFDVLHYLIDHAGRLVTRQELLRALWPGLIVTDDSLTQCLTDIRRALGDGSHDIIRTVPRKGYVFELSVETKFRDSREAPALAGGNSGAPIRRTIGSRIAISVAFILAALVGWWLIQPSRTPSAQIQPSQLPSTTSAVVKPAPLSVAVLPFLDLRARARITSHFRIPSSRHLWPVISCEILTYIEYAAVSRFPARPNLTQIRARIL